MGSKTQKCIWMEAGVVEYQLCPLNLNCEKCDFYHKMSHGCNQPTDPVINQKFITFQKPKIENCGFQAGYQYLPGHFWFKHVAKNRVLLGMDDILCKMVCPPEGIIQADPGTHLQKGNCFAWIIIPNGIVYLKMPITGLVLAHNPILTMPGQRFKDLRDTPIEDKWLLSLEIDRAELSLTDSLTKKEYMVHALEDCENIYQTVQKNYLKHVSSAGEDTDNFEPEADRLILEKVNYLQLLKNITLNYATIR